MATTFYSSRNSDIYANTSYSGADMIASVNIPASGNVSGGQFVIGDLQTFSYSLHMERGSVRSLGNINVKDYTNGPRTIAGSLVFAVFDKHIIYKFKEVLNKNGEYLADELPPFDVTISCASEYGHRSVLRIYGIRLLNEGEVMSINDIYTENTYQYVARDLEYMKSVSDLFEDEAADDNATTSANSTTSHTVADVNVSTSLVLLSISGQSGANDGIASFTIKNYDTTDYDLVIKNTQSKMSYYYHLNTTTLPFSCALPAGEYVASLMAFGSKTEMIDQINFKVDAIVESQKLKGFYINNALFNTITGERIDTSIEEICYTDGDKTISKKIDERGYFELTGLGSQKPYVFYGKTSSKNVTPTITVATKIGAIELFEQFKSYILANKTNMLSAYVKDFNTIYENALDCLRESNHTYSLTRSFCTIAETPAAYYFAFLANRYEMNLYASSRELHFYLYRLYTHEFFIETNLEKLVIYDSNKKKIKIVESNTLTTEKGFYKYTLSQKPGLYTLIFYFKNHTESHLEYYVLNEAVMSELVSDIARQKKLFEESLDAYYWNYKNVIQATSSFETDIFTKLFVFNHQARNHSIVCSLKSKTETQAIFHLDCSFSVEQPKYLVFTEIATEQLALPAIKFPIVQDVCTVAYTDYGIVAGQYYYYYVENAKGQAISEIGLFNTAFPSALNDIYKTLFLKDYAKNYESSYKDYFEAALVNDCDSVHDAFALSLQEICNLNDSRTKDTLLALCFNYYWDYLFSAPIAFSSKITSEFKKQDPTQYTFMIHANGFVYDKLFCRFYDTAGDCVFCSSYTKTDVTLRCDLTRVQYVVYYYYINQQYSQCCVYNLLKGELCKLK